ncbi:Facilitated trehalose transporter Tret1-2 homolog [Eumeta japonica]|uniref:Facilitated trehalose transporter Tret1-2 homolog n=1 Tax=Eumeta variegata TaxID=151549 RepID=A0A4C1XTV0_EUMVA|nr:Facilitated trehalose transporter Tret1-2 homolog [Eumeta japonica]
MMRYGSGAASAALRQRTFHLRFLTFLSIHDERSFQTVVSLGVFMMTLGAGATAGFSAVLIPQLQDAGNAEEYSTETISWVAGIASFPLFFGNLISGYLMERLGRRMSLLMLSVPFVLGWIIIGLANEIYVILLGRFITGFCQGWLGPLGPVFVGEISSPDYRGFFLASLSLAIALGVFLSHLFGTILHWKFAAFLCGAFPLAAGMIMLFAPESPSWLASRGRFEECLTWFYWYRSRSDETKNEVDKMIAEQTKRAQNIGKMTILKENMKKPEFYKPLGIMITFFIITQLSGVNVICAYTPLMLKVFQSNKSTDYSFIAMLAIDILRCISMAAACVLLRKLGRRPMAIFSGTLTASSLLLLALYLLLLKLRIISIMSPLIAYGLMSIYIIVSNMGIVPLPWNMVGELFATATKGIGSGISVMMTSIAFFGTVKSAPALFEAIGYEGAYLFYGLSTLFGTVFLYFYLPETKNKTLLQIEEYFRGNNIPKNKEKHMKDFSNV